MIIISGESAEARIIEEIKRLMGLAVQTGAMDYEARQALYNQIFGLQVAHQIIMELQIAALAEDLQIKEEI